MRKTDATFLRGEQMNTIATKGVQAGYGGGDTEINEKGGGLEVLVVFKTSEKAGLTALATICVVQIISKRIKRRADS